MLFILQIVARVMFAAVTRLLALVFSLLERSDFKHRALRGVFYLLHLLLRFARFVHVSFRPPARSLISSARFVLACRRVPATSVAALARRLRGAVRDR